jgi:hypothetical protein
MKKVFRLIQMLVAITCGFTILFWLFDVAPWQVKVASGILFAITMTEMARD